MQHISNTAYAVVIVTNRIGILYIVAAFLAFTEIALCSDASSPVHATNYNVSSPDNPATYYQSMPVKTAADAATLPNPAPLSTYNVHKLAISDLTRDFHVQLKAIEDNEMLIRTIQNAFDTFEQPLSDQNDTRTFNQIAGKIDVKLSTAMRIVSEISQRALGILSEPLNNNNNHLFLDTIVMPSSLPSSMTTSSSMSPTIKHSERRALDTNDSNASNDRAIDTNSSIGYVGGNENGKPIEIWNFLKNADHLHQTDDKNFTVNRRLMELLKDIDFGSTHVPHIRDAFFIPSPKFAGNDICRNKILCAHHRYMYASSIKWRNVIMVIDYGYTADDPHVLDAIKAFGMVFSHPIFH